MDLSTYLGNLPAEQQPETHTADDSLIKMADSLKEAYPKTIHDALPALARTLRSQNGNARGKALFLVFVIELRPDGMTLLAPLTQQIVARLEDEQPRVQVMASQIIMNWQPYPPPEAVPVLIRTLATATAKTVNGPDLVFTLAKLAPDQPDVIDAIVKYMARADLTAPQRTAAVNALRAHSVSEPRLINAIEDTCRVLTSKDQAYCVRVIGEMGNDVVRQAEPLLRSIAESEASDPDSRAEAKKALNTIDRR